MNRILPFQLKNIVVLTFIFLLAGFVNVDGADFYSRQTGNWNARATWSYTSGGGQVNNGDYPGIGDNVFIEANRTVTVNVSSACTNVTIASGSLLTMGGYSFTVSGTTTVKGTITFTNTSGTKTMGNVIIAGGTWTSNAGEAYAMTNLTLSGSTINGSSIGILNVSGNLIVTGATTNTLNATTITINGTTTVNGRLNFASTTGTKIFIGHTTINSGGIWDNDNVNEAINFRGGLTNTGTFYAGTSIYTFNTNHQAILGILTIPNITVTGITLTNNGNLTVSTALSGTGGITQGVDDVLNIGGTSGITTLTASASGNTVNYMGPNQTVKGVAYSDLTLSGSGTKVLQTGTTTIGGNLTIDNVSTTAVTELSIGGDLILDRAFSFTSGAFTHNLAGNWTRNGWGSFTPGIGTINFTGNNASIGGTQGIQTFNNITVSKTSGQTLATGGSLATFTINGDFTLTSGNYDSGSITTVILGNWINNGGLLSSGTGAILMKGSGKTIGGSSSTTFTNLTINNNGGGILLARDQTVNGTLALSNGLLKLGSYHLTLGPSAPAIPGSFYTGNMVVADGTGELRKVFTTNGSYTFPIGDNSDGTANISPITLDFTAGTYAGGAYAGVRVTDAKHPNNPSTLNYLTRYWSVSQSGIGSFSCTLTGTYISGDVVGREDLQTGARYSGSLPWITYSDLGSSKLTATGLTSFGDFTGIQVPVITSNQSALTGFSYVEYSGPSVVQSFALSGVNLTSGIEVTPPADFEISLSSNSEFQSTPLTIPQSGGFVYGVNVYVRLKAGLLGGDYPSENIIASSTGATSQTTVVSGNVIEIIKQFRSLATGNWNSTATWQQSIDEGATWMAATKTPDNTSLLVTIRSPHSVTLTESVSIDELTIDTGGKVTVNSGQTLTIANGSGTDMTVNGTVVNSGTIITNGTLVFNSGSTYQHAQNGGFIPSASWDKASTCLVTGITTNVPTVASFGQEFGNFTWNCTGQTSAVSLIGNLTTINGDFTVVSTGSTPQILNLAISGINFTTTVKGNYLQLGGNLTLNGTNGICTLNLAGNFTMTGGTLARGNGTGIINFNGSSIQGFSKSSSIISGNIPFTILSGATVDFGTSVLDGTLATFNLDGGGSIITANTEGLSTAGATGSIQVGGTRSFNNGANYTFNGTNPQVTGNGLTGVNNLTIDNSQGVTLSAATTVSGIVALTNGILTSNSINTLTVTNSSNNAITGGSTSRFVNGPLIWQLAPGQAYIYPIGKGVSYLPFGLGAITGTAPRVRAEAFAENVGGSASIPLGLLSTSEYWQASVSSGTYTNGSVSITRQTVLNGMESIGRSSTRGGIYLNLNGSASETSIHNSDNTGNTLGFFVMAAKASISCGPISQTSYCQGSPVNVPFTITGNFSSGSIFTAQLSNSSGSFASPVNIGTLVSTTAGTISSQIPFGIVPGTGYRIRVVYSAPNVTGTDNGSDLTVIASASAPEVGAITQPTCVLSSGSVVLNELPPIWTLTRNPGEVITTGTGTSTTITGLSPGTHTFSVSVGDNTGSCPGSGTGLTGSYFNNMTLAGVPAVSRTDASVDFNWGAGSPAPEININAFSVRWTGMVQACYTGDYTFTTRSDDGIRLWVKGIQLIDQWNNHSATDHTGTISLAAGEKYEIVLEFYENGADAVAQLSWTPPGQNKQLVPQSQLYPNITTGCNSPESANVVIDPLPTPPAPPVASLTVQPTCDTPTGSVVLSGLPPIWTLTRNPGGVITTGTGTSTTITGLLPGNHTFSVRDDSGPCPEGSGTGLMGNYFVNDRTFTGAPALRRLDAKVNFNWGNGSPDASLPLDNFSVRWTGVVQACYSENYTFTTNSDDGIQLWVDGQKIINNWTDHGPTINTGNINLIAGKKYDIVLEFYENAGGALAQLSWSSVNQPLQIIPQSQLYPEAGCPSPESANVVINAIPMPPATPVASVSVQPTCAVPTGTIVISSPAGAVYEHQLDGGVYQSSRTFTGVSVGVHTVRSRLVASASCISPASSNLTVNAIPMPPATPVASVMLQPTCAVATGTIGISAPLGSAYEYQLDAGVYQSSPTFTGVSIGNHTVRSRLVASPTCISPVTSVTLFAQAVPTVSHSGSVSVCQNAPAPEVTFHNPSNLPITVILFVTSIGDIPLNIGANSSISLAVPTEVPGIYEASNIRVSYQTAPSCTQILPDIITVRVNPIPNIAAKTITVCSGTVFNVSPTNGTDIVPSGTTYSWSAPLVAGITGMVAGINVANISGILTNTTNSAINISYTVTPSSANCSGSPFTVMVTVNPDGSWTGVLDNNWNNPGNWACNEIPSITTDVIIANERPHYPILASQSVGTARNLTIENNASLTVIGNRLQISGSVSNAGTFITSEGTIEMKGNTAQIIGANVFTGNKIMDLTVNNPAGVTLLGPLAVTGIVTALNGNLHSGGNLTLVSTAIQTALIDGTGTGNVLGNVNMQRFLPSAFGYKYVSSPFQSATVAEWAQEVNLGATFSSFYKYDENNSIDSSGVMVYKSGWGNYHLAGNSLVPLTGYAANLGANVAAPSITANMTGVVNNGHLQMSLYNHNRKFTKGFNLVGNPYPSPIDWNSPDWTKVNIDDAIYFFNASGSQFAGVYSSYVNGETTGNEDNIIAAMQGFFIHVSDGPYPVSGILGVANSVRTNDLNPVFKKAVIDTRIRLHFTAYFEHKNAMEDAAVIYFENNANLRFESEMDALKMTNTDLLVPNIYSLTPESVQLSINGMPLPSDSISKIPMGITTFADGWITLTAEDISRLPSFLHIYLLDAETGQQRNLKQLPDYRFYLKSGQYDGRFSLIFSQSELSEQIGIPGKLFTLLRSGDYLSVKAHLPDNIRGNLMVTNLLGQVILRREIYGNETVEINQSVSTGIYVFTLRSGEMTHSEKVIMRKDYE